MRLAAASCGSQRQEKEEQRFLVTIRSLCNDPLSPSVFRAIIVFAREIGELRSHDAFQPDAATFPAIILRPSAFDFLNSRLSEPRRDIGRNIERGISIRLSFIGREQRREVFSFCYFFFFFFTKKRTLDEV